MRDELGYTQKQVAEEMDWSLSKLNRIEKAWNAISISDLRALLLHYKITDPVEVGRLEQTARASKDRDAWWETYKDVTSEQYLTFLAFESSASRIFQFEPLLIPGLLQIQDYARAVLTALAGSAGKQRVQEWVKLRMRRQRELFRRSNPPEMEFIIDEAALRRWVGGRDVMRRQLLHLKEIATKENVTIEIIPLNESAHPGLRGPQVILEFADDEDQDVLYLENSTGDMISRLEEKDLKPARESFKAMQDLSKGNIDEIIDDILRTM